MKMQVFSYVPKEGICIPVGGPTSLFRFLLCITPERSLLLGKLMTLCLSSYAVWTLVK